MNFRCGMACLLLAAVTVQAGCGREREDAGYMGAQLDIPPTHVEITRAELWDRIMGGLTAQLLGNLNGLEHEFEYFERPGNVGDYTPSLPDGARTDDDTDIEWVYIYNMQHSGELFLPPDRISELWKRHINRSIWASNRYSRNLMELDLDPPFTGRAALNPWAVFNISGQFVCESFGLIAPGMPQAAAMIGTHYTHVTIDGEPAQATQLFTTMIARAFFESDVDSLLDTGLEAIDPASEHVELVKDVRKWHAGHPDDWRAVRELVRRKYARYGDRDGRETRDGNAYELNSCSTIAALLYGGGDLAETLRIAFNFGWDADNNAATAATIIGVTRGWNWIERQGWDIADRYRNTTRDEMPEDETISSFAERMLEVAEMTIARYGGEVIRIDGEPGYRIKLQQPANVEPLPMPVDRMEQMRAQLMPLVEKWLEGPSTAKARAAYVAIALGQAGRIEAQYPALWTSALDELRKYPRIISLLYSSPAPSGDRFRRNAREAGIEPPADGDDDG